MNTPTTIFFDVGNTLISANPHDFLIPYLRQQGVAANWARLPQAIEYGFRHYVREHDHAKTEAQGLALWQQFDRIFLTELEVPEVEQWVERLSLLWQDPQCWPLLPGAKAVLEKLKQAGFQLLVVSNWGGDLPAILEVAGIKDYFTGLSVSALVGASKPRPEIFAAALAMAGATAQEVWHIGDSYENDVLGARAMGITPVLFGNQARSGIVDPDVVCIEQLHDLLPLLGLS
jgi:putative hydrolase of the HAD superfamily